MESLLNVDSRCFLHLLFGFLKDIIQYLHFPEDELWVKTHTELMIIKEFFDAWRSLEASYTAQKMEFSIKDFFSKCD